MSNKRVKKIGWTSFIVSEYNKYSYILVKKNLFDGFTVIDESGLKCSKDDLLFLKKYKVHCVAWQLFSNRTLLKGVNGVFESQKESNKKLNNCIQDLRSDYDQLFSEATKLSGDFEQLKCSNKELSTKLSNSNKENEQLRSHFDAGFDNVYTSICNISGESVVYKSPTLYQVERGVTCNPQVEYYNEQNKYYHDMSDYLTELIKNESVPSKYKELLNKLNNTYKMLKKRVYDAYDCNDSIMYNQAYVMKFEFVNQFRDFFYLWRSEMGESDVSCCWTDTRYGRGDEKSTYCYSALDMIKQGEKACSLLILLMLGEDAQKEFEANVKSSTDEYNSIKSEQKKLS